MGKVVVESPLINTLFKCPLCYGLIRSPTVINECLHRFCKVCITNYFEKKNNNNKCPTCQMTIVNPLETLKSDLTFQRLLYKIFPSIFQREIACRPSLLSPAITNESTRIYIDSTIDVYLEYWDISLDLFPNSNNSSVQISPSYLECKASTPLLLIEKFIRIKYSLTADLKIDLFYKTFQLNSDSERLIDICYCFDRMTKDQPLDIRFLISPYGYKAILNRIHQLKNPTPSITKNAEPTPLPVEKEEKQKAEVSAPLPSSSPSSSNSSLIDPKIKVKIRRSQVSTNDWYIPQSNPSGAEPVDLPDLVNSCETIKKSPKRKQQSTIETAKKKTCTTSMFFSTDHVSQPSRTSLIKPQTKPRRRTRFIPTMVKAPPSIFDRLSSKHYDYSDQDPDSPPICSANDLFEQPVTTLRPSEMVIVNVEGNVSDTTESKRTQKTICKVPPYVPETSTINNSPPEKTTFSSIVKPTPIYPTHSPMRRTLLPKKIPTIIPSLSNQALSPDSNNAAPLDLSLK